METEYGSFQRQFVLPERVQAQDIQANYGDGILEMVVPKAAEQRQARRIPVVAGSEPEALTAPGGESEPEALTAPGGESEPEALARAAGDGRS